MTFWLYIVGGTLLEVLGDYYLKKQENLRGLAIYFLGSYLWALSLKKSELSRAIVIFTVINIIFAVAIGIVYFNESLTPRQICGMVLAVISIFLIS